MWNKIVSNLSTGGGPKNMVIFRKNKTWTLGGSGVWFPGKCFEILSLQQYFLHLEGSILVFSIAAPGGTSECLIEINYWSLFCDNGARVCGGTNFWGVKSPLQQIRPLGNKMSLRDGHHRYRNCNGYNDVQVSPQQWVPDLGHLLLESCNMATE